MNGVLIIVIALVALACGYKFYGKWLEKLWGIDDKLPTPAHSMEDGVDYVPTKKQVVFGHQFASIAGAGPINGPIQAAIFGWVPVLLWCILGGIFFGAVQDFSSMYASVRNKGRSIGIIIENYVGKTGKKLFLLFVYLFSILVVAAFGDIVAKSFGVLPTWSETVNHSNGQVASASTMFIFAAIGLGLFLRKVKPNTAVNTTVSIVVLIACIAIGYFAPFFISVEGWRYLVFAYCLIASVAPVWILLQPRDYLNSYLLVAMIVASIIGIFVAHPAMNLPAFTGFVVDGTPLFPILFVTVACGAVSGFHSLVSSETASKQVDKETDMLPISYGAMLVESLLGVVSLIAVGAVAAGGKIPAGTPQQIFSNAISGFLAKLHINTDVSFTLVNLAVSAFALTSLDSVARVGRLSIQEFFMDRDTDMAHLSPALKVLTNKWFASLLVLIPSFALSLSGYGQIWALFGSANQLLSVLALCAVAVFLKSTKKNNKMMLFPMFFMLVVTCVSLFLLVFNNIKTFGHAKVTVFGQVMQIVFAILLIALAFIVAMQCFKKLFGKKEAENDETKAAAATATAD
jgi:carbon starvation protein